MLLSRARLRPGAAHPGRRPRRRRPRITRSATCGGRPRSTCSAGASPSTSAPRASPAPPTGTARDGAGAAQPHRRATCGRSSPTAASCGCCATPPPSPGRPTSSSTSRRCSTASSSPSSSLLYLLCPPVPRRGPPTTAGRATAGSSGGAPPPSSQGVRALTLLRDGVERRPRDPRHRLPAAPRQRRRCASGSADGELRPRRRATRALLRLVYRLLFWAVAEDRDALLDPDADPPTQRQPLRATTSPPPGCAASRCAGTAARHDDLWQAVTLVLDALGRDGGEPRLGLPGLGGLFAPRPGRRRSPAAGCPTTRCSPRSARLSVVQPKGQPRRARRLRATSAPRSSARIYESLLELVPRHDPISHAFTLEIARRQRPQDLRQLLHARPTLVDLVLDTALDPVLDDAEKRTPTPRTAERAARPHGLRPRLSGPATSSSPPPAASPRASPRSAPASSTPPRPTTATPCTTSSPAASTASTSTRWPPTSPRSASGSTP